jgi:ATP phosphoribosyltransferase regulatory subunit
VFEERGYREIAPSMVEFHELYRRGNQSVEDRTVKFLDRDDHLLALRADFTPAIARIAASRLLQFPRPIRVWYAGSVFRKVEPKRGRYCEFSQVGGELLGPATVEHNLEIIDLALSALDALGIRQTKLHVNHAGIFRSLVNELHLDRKALRQVKAAIDRKDARGLAARLESLGVSSDIHDQLEVLASCVGGEEVLQRASDAVSNTSARYALAELRGLARGLERWKDLITFDLAEIDEMEYYTGVMFTIFHPRLTSELGGGGRYDALLREFGAELPAVGFSLSMDALAELL